MAVSTGRSVTFYSTSVCSQHLARDLALLFYIQGGPGFKFLRANAFFLRIATFLFVTPFSPVNNCQAFVVGNLLAEFSDAKILFEVLQKLSLCSTLKTQTAGSPVCR